MKPKINIAKYRKSQVLSIVSLATDELNKVGMRNEAKEMACKVIDEANTSKQALEIIENYVQIEEINYEYFYG